MPIIDPFFNEIKELDHLAPHFLREVEHFFDIYKDLEGKRVETLGWETRETAEKAINISIEAAKR